MNKTFFKKIVNAEIITFFVDLIIPEYNKYEQINLKQIWRHLYRYINTYIKQYKRPKF